MNRHPLTADFGMYYSGTYVFRNGPKGVEAMYVEHCTRDGDDTKPSGVVLHGHAYSTTNELNEGRWKGDELIAFRPVSGYFDLKHTQKRANFVTFSVSNRTQRKGFDSRTVIVGGAPWNPTGIQVARIFEQSQGLDSRPGHRDIYIDGDKVHWKGVHVGLNDKEGKFAALKQFKQFEDMVCQLLQSI